MNYNKMNFKYQEYLESNKNPSIIHYTGSSKPWQYLNKHPLKNEYYKYLKRTCWKKYIPKDKNIKNVSKMFVKKYFPTKAIAVLKIILRSLHINY